MSLNKEYNNRFCFFSSLLVLASGAHIKSMHMNFMTVTSSTAAAAKKKCINRQTIYPNNIFYSIHLIEWWFTVCCKIRWRMKICAIFVFFSLYLTRKASFGERNKLDRNAKNTSQSTHENLFFLRYIRKITQNDSINGLKVDRMVCVCLCG